MKKHTLSLMAALAVALLITGCTPGPKASEGLISKDESAAPSDAAYDMPEAPGGDYGGEGGEGEAPAPGGNSQAGRVTAGEWNDLDHWDFWGKLMTGEEYAGNAAFWGFWTNNRIAVTVEDAAGAPLSGIRVSLLRGGSLLWSSRTDNLGRAECWVGLFQQEENVDPSSLTLKVLETEVAPKITAWDCPNGPSVNKVVLGTASPAAQKADIAFLVDATGSMADEIQFLKDDLMDILRKVGSLQSAVTFRSAALFYRDEGDEYLTRPFNFTADHSQTVDFISQQSADGGGDYPEAVHTALEQGLQSLSWDEEAKTRIAFLLLDAPAHHQTDVIASLQKSIQAYAAAGIKIIPISASGIDKGTEFMLRFFAAATGGTYVFITNDSGIGGDHIEATVGDYDVELLNELLVRLIKKYTD